MFFKVSALKNLADRKTPVLESIFNRVAVLRPAALSKRDSNSNTGVSGECCKISKKGFFHRTPLLDVLKQVESSLLLVTIN